MVRRKSFIIRKEHRDGLLFFFFGRAIQLEGS